MISSWLLLSRLPVGSHPGQQQAGVVREGSLPIAIRWRLADRELAGSMAACGLRAPAPPRSAARRAARHARASGQGPSNIGTWIFSRAVSVGMR